MTNWNIPNPTGILSMPRSMHSPTGIPGWAENIRIKSIVREMFETYSSFNDYIRSYELHRAEGLLLRHVNSVYGVLAQTVPDSVKTEEVEEMEIFLKTMLRQVDTSLMDEWEKMRNPAYQPARGADIKPPGADQFDITRDAKTFTALIRANIFAFLSALAKMNYDAALALAAGNEGNARENPSVEPAASIDPGNSLWTAERLGQLWEAYRMDHQCVLLDPQARNIRNTYITVSPDKKTWTIQQMLIDPEGHNDWVAEFEVDIVKSRTAEEAVMRLRELGALQ